ncbi:MAG: hypothetical protein ACK41S_08205 [Planctomycetota bacterium]
MSAVNTVNKVNKVNTVQTHSRPPQAADCSYSKSNDLEKHLKSRKRQLFRE